VASQARDLLEDTISNFTDTATPFFYFTSDKQTDLILRKKEIYDGALPSSNAVMAENLYRLGTIFDRSGWTVRSEQMVAGLGQAILRYPGSFGYWCRVLTAQVQGVTEVAMLGPEALDWLSTAGKIYLPGAIFLVAATPVSEPSRFADPALFNRTSVQVCRKNTCLAPVYSPKELLIKLKNMDFSQ